MLLTALFILSLVRFVAVLDLVHAAHLDVAKALVQDIQEFTSLLLHIHTIENWWHGPWHLIHMKALCDLRLAVGLVSTGLLGICPAIFASDVAIRDWIVHNSKFVRVFDYVKYLAIFIFIAFFDWAETVWIITLICLLCG